MNFISSVKRESKLFPGVFYCLNRMSEARRSQLRLKIAEPTSKIRAILREMNKLEEKYPSTPESPRPEEITDELLAHGDRLEDISSGQVNPAWLLWGCKSIDGLQIDGQDATPQLLIDAGPPALFVEIVDEIKSVAQLNGEEEKNLESLTTSGEQTGGTKSDSSAAIASSTASSGPATEIAVSTSLN